MPLFRKRFSPDLLDLIQYEKDCLYRKVKGLPILPPVCIPGLVFSNWSKSEMQAMRDNREKAYMIYEKYKGHKNESNHNRTNSH